MRYLIAVLLSVFTTVAVAKGGGGGHGGGGHSSGHSSGGKSSSSAKSAQVQPTKPTTVPIVAGTARGSNKCKKDDKRKECK